MLPQEINSKRKLQQVISQDNVENGKNNNEKMRKKKTTSLQGRPAKASQELRKLEEEIKKVAWRNAELDECCYLVHGGAQAIHNEQHQNKAIESVLKEFKSQKAVNEFQSMLKQWQTLKKELRDPLNEKFVLLGDKFFIDQLINNKLIQNDDNKLKNEVIKKEDEKVMDIQSFLIIYSFQLFLKTDLEGFNSILKLLKLVYQHCESEDNSISIEHTLSPEFIIPKIQNFLEEKDRQKMIVLYKLLYVVMAESYLYLDPNKEIILRKLKSGL